MAERTALVTLAIGEKYEKPWREICRANWQAYADRHGYEVVLITEPLDDSALARSRSAAWQKCLILSQDWSADYDRIVWVDSDNLINYHAAPPVVEGVPPDKVGAANSVMMPTRSLGSVSLQRRYEHWGEANLPYRNYTARAWYEVVGLPGDYDDIVCTGVMVFSPRHHRDVLEQIYQTPDYAGPTHAREEMRPLSYEFLKRDLAHWIDSRFNIVVPAELALNYPFLWNAPAYRMDPASRVLRKLGRLLGQEPEADRLKRLCLNTMYLNSYFMHFATCIPDMALVDTRLSRWQDVRF